MGYGITLRERFSTVRFLVNAQKTVWYQVLFAVLCIISGSFDRNVYLPIIFVLCAFVIFSVIFTDDNKVFLTPMLMIYYSLGRDNVSAIPGVDDNLLTSSFDADAFKIIVICGIVVVSAFVARLIVDGSIAAAFKQRRVGAIGILTLDVALMLNGAFNPNYTPMNLLYGFIIAITFTLFYFSCSGMLSQSSNFIDYACSGMVCTAYVALSQVLIVIYPIYQQGKLFYLNSNDEIIGINRSRIILSWGLSTIIAAVFVLGIPAALYLARNRKHSPIWYISAALFLIGTVIINTRSAMIVGFAAFAVGSVICCLKNEKHKQNAVWCRVLFSISIIIGLLFVVKMLSVDNAMEKLLTLLRLDNFDNSSRIGLWEKGIADFTNFPIFGAGFDTGSNISNNVFSSMYHCIIIQFLGSMGIVGAIAFIIHAASLVVICFKNSSLDKFLILLLPLMLIGMSLVDNFFFYPNFQIFYCVFIVLAEYYIEHKDGHSDIVANGSQTPLPDITVS